MKNGKMPEITAEKRTSFFRADHLTELERIVSGAFYTPPHLVEKVYELIELYISENTVILDPAGGCGSFILPLSGRNIPYRVAERDKEAVQFLRKHFRNDWIIETDSLIDVSREKFKIREIDHLIVVGNPPYNDITSEYRKGQKGDIICDSDLFDRDIGISFLKMFDKIRADVVCVLHPLSYLIKEANFRRLGRFRDSYRLVEAYIFPSTEFEFTSRTSCFPVVIALYLRGEGMSYDYIRNFIFRFLNEEKKTFCLNRYTTIDGYINKYPPRKKDSLRKSPIGIYYYSFRDLNSVIRNASFTLRNHNSVVVTPENFYK